MKLEPTSKQMLALELQKLAGADAKMSLLRWARSMNMMSGAFVVLRGKPEGLTPAHFDEWFSRMDTLRKDMERLAKKYKPKAKRKL